VFLAHTFTISNSWRSFFFFFDTSSQDEKEREEREKEREREKKEEHTADEVNEKLLEPDEVLAALEPILAPSLPRLSQEGDEASGGTPLKV
jgi:hypothetical protein